MTPNRKMFWQYHGNKKWSLSCGSKVILTEGNEWEPPYPHIKPSPDLFRELCAEHKRKVQFYGDQ